MNNNNNSNSDNPLLNLDWVLASADDTVNVNTSQAPCGSQVSGNDADILSYLWGSSPYPLDSAAATAPIVVPSNAIAPSNPALFDSTNGSAISLPVLGYPHPPQAAKNDNSNNQETPRTNSGSNSSNNSNKDDNSNGRRQSEDDDGYISESQLKMMTSKERRQLRNKISARKFRNRRKEYISMLEAEVQKQKSENNQLRLEVSWIRATADKLQKENDRLRLELVLCREGIRPRRNLYYGNDNPPAGPPSAPYRVPNPSTMARPSSLTPPSYGSSSMGSDPSFVPSDASSTSSHKNSPSDMREHWNLIFTDPRPHYTYLSHAVVPDWDLDTILKKERQTSNLAPNDLFQKYPLLAPALMSIVLSHTMTMTPEELVSHAKLLPPPSNLEDAPRFLANDLWFGPKFGGITKRKASLTGNNIRTMWEVQQKITVQTECALEKEEQQQHASKQNEIDENELAVATTGFLPDNCPLLWIQKQFCRFVYAYVIARYPHLEPQCQQYLPICDKYRRQYMLTAA